MVEAPGTAPGSEWFITMTIYRHSSCEQSLYRRPGGPMQMLREISALEALSVLVLPTWWGMIGYRLPGTFWVRLA